MFRFIYLFLFVFICNMFSFDIESKQQATIEDNNNLYFLNQEEIKYIKENKIIKMCNNPNWSPIEFVENGQADGIAIDILKELEKKLDIKIKHIQTASWSQSQDFLRDKRCDILPAASITKQRKKYAIFTEPYLKYKLAIITQNDKSFIKGIEAVLDKTMTRKEGSGLISKLKNKYPSIKIKETKGYEESLKLVAQGKAYCTIATLPVASHYISKFGLYNLHIAGYTNNSFNLSIAVRDDRKILKNILNKTLKTLSSQAIQNIENNWSKVTIDEKSSVDYSLLAKLLIVIVLIILFILYRQSELKKHHKTLKEQNQKFKKMLDTSIEAIIISKDQIIIDSNQSAFELLGTKTKEDLLHRNIFEFASQESLELIKSQVLKDHTKPYEATLQTLNKNKFPALIKGVNHTTENETIRFIAILDLTNIKEKENLLSQSSKMAQMGEMIGNIAHQWRQPLSVITTAATGIKIKKEFDMLEEKELFSFIDSITTNATHLSDTIDTFRNFIKEKVELRDVVIQHRIDNALNIISTRLENKYIKLIKNIDYSEDIIINIVLGELSQVIINIMNNSIDVLVEREIDDKWIKINSFKENNKAIITIEDNAGGVKKDIMSKIFEPYFTTKHQSVGTGIGLYMSYDIIKNHMNGDLYVKNTKYGAKFFIELPLPSDWTLAQNGETPFEIDPLK
ncbi:MAG: transporter substrate-binding domain-containing protein [Campylobacterota bacterium]|nr:transporter substrate-binding domain-containing protein [Campylobacterota bacterium]